MSMLENLVQKYPWRAVGGAFLVGVGLAIDRRTRQAIVLSALQIGRAVAVEHAKRYARAWTAAGGATMAYSCLAPTTGFGRTML